MSPDSPSNKPQDAAPFAPQIPPAQRIAYDAAPSGPSNVRTAIVLMLGIGFVAMLLLALGVVGVGAFYWLARSDSPAPSMNPREFVPTPSEPKPQPVPPAQPPAQPVQPPGSFGTDEPVAPEPSPPSPTPAIAESQPVNDAPAKPRPTPAAPKKAPVDAAGSQPRYAWKNGERYTYEYKVEAKLDGNKTFGANGYVTYLPAPAPDQKPAAREPDEAFGSGFLINAQGHLVTCAHVVKGATKIETVIGDRTYPVRVIGVDARRDLAIAKIEGDRLPALSLGDSAQVELASDVRVVGFPFADRLGSSVKITRGTISGILDRERGRTFQIDAAINPGNSGGPMFNDRGEVIGVANARLRSDGAMNVGFAIPVADVRALLEKHQVPFDATPQTASLAGPELIKRVAPSVVLLNVTLNAGESDELATTLHYVADIHHNELPKESNPSRFGPFGPFGFRPATAYWQTERAKLVVDAAGELLDGGGEQSLPFLLGETSLLAIVPLGDDGENSWSRQRVLSLIKKEKKEDNDGPWFGPRIPRPPFIGGPFGSPPPKEKEKVEAVSSALERQEFEIRESTADTIVIQKRLDLETTDASAPTKLHLKGQGRIVLDRRAGVPRESTFDGTLEIELNNVSIRLPFTSSVTLQAEDNTGNGVPANTPTWLPPSVVKVGPERELKTGQQVFCGFHNQWPTVTVNAARPDGLVDVSFPGWDSVWNATVPRSRLALHVPAAPKPAEPLAANDLDALLKQITDTNGFKASDAFGKLAKAEPNERRAEVAAAIVPHVTGAKEWFVREGAIQALARWGTAENVPTFVEALKDSHHGSKRHALAALGNFPTREAAEALVSAFTGGTLHDAKGALEKLGSVAEEPVATLLESKDWHVQFQAAQVLQKIGTAKSLPVLKATAEKTTLLAKKGAVDAIAAIEKRVAESPPPAEKPVDPPAVTAPPPTSQPEGEPERVLRAFLIALATGARNDAEKISVARPDSDLLWQNPPPADAVESIRQQAEKSSLRRLKVGDKVTLSGGREVTISERHVNETRLSLTVEGHPVPFVVVRDGETWKVDPQPLISARKAAQRGE